MAGLLLYQLSSKVLSRDRNYSTPSQLSKVAAILSHKLAVIGFGSHLALHTTRVGDVYFNSNLPIPRTLLSNLTIESMTEFLYFLHRALHEESTILYFTGCDGVEHVLALVMALCPEDTLVTVEDEVIFQGSRRSVIIAVKSEG